MAAGTLCRTIARATRLVSLVSVLRLDAPTANPSALCRQTAAEQASLKQGCQGQFLSSGMAQLQARHWM